MARHSEIVERFKSKLDTFDFSNADYVGSVSRKLNIKLREWYNRQKAESVAAYPLKRKGWCTFSYVKRYGFSCYRMFLIARLPPKGCYGLSWTVNTRFEGFYYWYLSKPIVCGIPDFLSWFGIPKPRTSGSTSKIPPFRNPDNLSWCAEFWSILMTQSEWHSSQF